VVGSIAVLAFNRFSAVAWVLPVLALLLIGVGRRLSPRAASRLAIGVLIAVSATFWATHALVLHRVQAVAARQFPGDRTLDIVLSPAPANPLCWDVMLLQRSGTDYVARMGQHSWAAQSCAGGLTMEGAAPLQPMQVPVMASVRWRAQFTIDAAALARLANTSCDTRRLASFLRAPFAALNSAGWILGDLRFDRGPGGGFASMRVDPAAPARCERSSPWVAPRRDLGL
jgi:inner membrane protein